MLKKSETEKLYKRRKAEVSAFTLFPSHVHGTSNRRVRVTRHRFKAIPVVIRQKCLFSEQNLNVRMENNERCALPGPPQQ